MAVTLPRRQIAVGRLKAGERVDVFVTYDERTELGRAGRPGRADRAPRTTPRSPATARSHSWSRCRAARRSRRWCTRCAPATSPWSGPPSPRRRATTRWSTRAAAAPPPSATRRVMAGDRFVVLGVAQVRSPWFREVARWATSAMLPIEFVKAMSVEEVRVRLRSGRGYSALLVDDSLPGVDRDLVELAREAGCAVLIVDSGRASRQWGELGASALLAGTFARDELLQVLQQVATPITPFHRRVPAAHDRDPPHRASVAGSWPSPVPPGAGRSTIAAALAQGLASDPRHTRPGVPGRPRAARRPGDAPRLARRRARAHRAGGGPPFRRTVDRRRAQPHVARHRRGATPCCSACAGIATGRRCGHGPSPPRWTGCGAGSGSWWRTWTTTSRVSRPPDRSTSRSATPSLAPRSRPPTWCSSSGNPG